jgi:threonine dehydrogenase-like Zn-dependent dehydrogenase
MKSAVLTGPRTLSLVDQPVPELQSDQVRVRLQGCGVCGSNLPVWEGRPWFHYPLPPGAPGHEGWGVVDDVGARVDNLRIGERVALLSYNAFAEYDVTEARNTVRLPPLLDQQPFPGEALGCAMNVQRRSAIARNHTVAILGAGFLGAVLTNLAARAGARVIVISRRRFALEIAREMGASETVVMDERSRVVEQVKELTRGEGCERVIEATGLQEPLHLAGEITRERGRLIIAGYHQDGLREVNMQLWNWRGLDVINAHERNPETYVEGMSLAVEAMIHGQLDPTPLYTHRFHLERLPEAFDTMRERPANFLKALVNYD